LKLDTGLDPALKFGRSIRNGALLNLSKHPPPRSEKPKARPDSCVARLRQMRRRKAMGQEGEGGIPESWFTFFTFINRFIFYYNVDPQ
jgi:hypothetical protein